MGDESGSRRFSNFYPRIPVNSGPGLKPGGIGKKQPSGLRERDRGILPGGGNEMKDLSGNSSIPGTAAQAWRAACYNTHGF